MFFLHAINIMEKKLGLLVQLTEYSQYHYLIFNIILLMRWSI